MKKNPPKNSVIINVCIVPSQKVGNECVELSQSLKSDSTMFVLDGKSKFAHMTVFMARFANSEVGNVLSTAEKTLKGANSFLCEQSTPIIHLKKVILPLTQRNNKKTPKKQDMI